MRRKVRRRVSLIVVLMLITLTVIGCGRKEELENPPTLSLEDIINEETLGDEKSEECPEGYVYDYQVSMEPIPKEIADLGGDVCGTIHAYPTRIQIALTKQEIENDEELQKQNEENIEGVKRYLEDTYGGEFEIEPLRIKYEYMCTEKSTGKKFQIFVNPLFEMDKKKNVILVDQYSYAEKAEVYKSELDNILDDIITEEHEFNVFYENGESLINGVLDVYISVFSNREVDYIEEQNQIIKIYKTMKEIQKKYSTDSFSLRLLITYFPSEYKEVITMQYNSQCLDDYTYIVNERAETLIQKGELYAQFEYSEKTAWNDENSLDKIVENDEYSSEEIILPYWR